MNLGSNPTEDDLRKLLASVDDDAGHHVIWVDMLGNVHITLWLDDVSPDQWMSGNAALKFRFETCDPGNGYVGAAASADPQYVRWLLEGLRKGWAEGWVGYADAW